MAVLFPLGCEEELSHQANFILVWPRDSISSGCFYKCWAAPRHRPVMDMRAWWPDGRCWPCNSSSKHSLMTPLHPPVSVPHPMKYCCLCANANACFPNKTSKHHKMCIFALLGGKLMLSANWAWSRENINIFCTRMYWRRYSYNKRAIVLESFQQVKDGADDTILSIKNKHQCTVAVYHTLTFNSVLAYIYFPEIRHNRCSYLT